MNNLGSSQNYFSWKTFDLPGMRHMKSKLMAMFEDSPVHLQEITPEEKYLCINGERGILRLKIYGV
jgi:hypothetical protein